MYPIDTARCTSTQPRSEPQLAAVHGKESISNIKLLVEILHNNNVDTTPKERQQLFGTELIPSTHEAHASKVHTAYYDADKLAKGEYKFKDLKTDITYTIDNEKTKILTNILNDRLSEKSVNFSVPTSSFHDMEIESLTTEEYKNGLPFMLSCKTQHCDFIGGFGGNYPLAEYLSADGVSCKITRCGDYVGHINAWKDTEGNILLGTLAIKQDDVKSKVLLQTLELFAKNLLQENPDTKVILLGIDGQNLSVLFPDKFLVGGDGHSPLGKIRHQDNIISDFPAEVQKLEAVTKMDIYGQVVIHNQDTIGMSPDNRLDMKNALIFMDAQKAKSVDSEANILLKEINTQSAYRENKETRTHTWQQIQDQGVRHRQERFFYIKSHLAQQGIIDVRLEASQGQDVTVSTPQKPEHLPFPVIESKEIQDRFFTKLRVGGQIRG